jgi:hypothetical protein
MMSETLAIPAVVILFLSGSALLGSRNWRISITALAFQYLGSPSWLLLAGRL